MSDSDTAPGPELPGILPRRMPLNWVPPPSTTDVLLRIQVLMDEQKEERKEKKMKNFQNYMQGKGGELLRELSQYRSFMNWKLQKQECVNSYHSKLFSEGRLPRSTVHASTPEN